MFNFRLVDSSGKTRDTAIAATVIQARQIFSSNRLHAGKRPTLPEGWKVVKRGPADPNVIGLGCRVRKVSMQDETPFGRTVPNGTLGTVVAPCKKHKGWWVVVWDGHPYFDDLKKAFVRDGEVYEPHELEVVPADAAPAAFQPPVTEWRRWAFEDFSVGDTIRLKAKHFACRKGRAPVGTTCKLVGVSRPGLTFLTDVETNGIALNFTPVDFTEEEVERVEYVQAAPAEEPVATEAVDGDGYEERKVRFPAETARRIDFLASQCDLTGDQMASAILVLTCVRQGIIQIPK